MTSGLGHVGNTETLTYISSLKNNNPHQITKALLYGKIEKRRKYWYRAEIKLISCIA